MINAYDKQNLSAHFTFKAIFATINAKGGFNL